MDTLTEHVAALDLDCLMGHIQALPRKLHDTIHDFVFTASSAIRHINANWSPPSSLHVSRLTRKSSSQQAYLNNFLDLFCCQVYGL